MSLTDLYSILRSIYPPSTNWTTDSIPSLSGKVAVITGASSGLGLHFLPPLLDHNISKIYVLCRSPSKAREALLSVGIREGEERVRVVRCDLGDLESVKSAAEEVLGKEKEIHLLINNAGVMNTPLTHLSAQGYDLQFGVNLLGHAYLTHLLLPTLFQTAKSSPPNSVRIVNLASSANFGAPRAGVMYATLLPSPARDKKASPSSMYYQSKWGNVVYTLELARRYADQGLISVSADPGWVQTDLWREQRGLGRWFTNLLLTSTDNGILTPLYAATSPGVTQAQNGTYFVPWARAGKARADAYEPKKGKELWEWVEGAIRKFEGGGEGLN